MLDEQTTKALIKKMFEKQNELNIHTNGINWKTNKNLKWYRAIWVECAELIDYTDWKWWRKQDFSPEDIKMEVIDIWHFIMSELMIHHSLEECIENTYFEFKNNFRTYPDINANDIQIYVENLVRSTITSKQGLIHTFVTICGTFGHQMNIDGIYKLYMGKNVLNKFRQDNGYKQKTYQKIWDGKEDNYYLLKFLDEIKKIDDNFEQVIYEKLQEKYQLIK